MMAVIIFSSKSFWFISVQYFIYSAEKLKNETLHQYDKVYVSKIMV